MTRHGKNSTASAVYSYSERKKDAKQSGYGTLHERLGADSIKEFDCCSITLQPCRNPVISPYGCIFDREAVIEYFLMQKKECGRRLKEWEVQCKKNEEEAERERNMENEIKMKKFLMAEGISTDRSGNDEAISTPKISAGASASGSKIGKKRHLAEDDFVMKKKKGELDISNVSGDKKNELPSFWIPQLNPTAEVRLEKPLQKVLCPMTGKVLKIKELMPVKFTPVNDDSDDLPKSIVSRRIRYKCPVTHDLLTNTMRCAYLKTSQSVVTMECVEKIIRKDMIDPLNGKKMNEDDIIELQRGGTGFSTTNVVKAKVIRPQLELQ